MVEVGGSTLLRTLTLKSQIKFGDFKHNTVGDLINMNHHWQLLKMYFLCSKITFTEEILMILRITPERRLQKPGCNRDISYSVLRECLREIKSNLSDPEQKILQKEINFNNKRDKVLVNFTEGMYQSKILNRTLNQNRVTK